MISHLRIIITSLLLVQVYSTSPAVFVPSIDVQCPNDFATTCHLQCPDGNYVLDEKGCPTCECLANIAKPIVTCPQIKCRANCGNAGYQRNENGCQTCKCVSMENVQCSRLMCRMFCQHGFKRDDNGCEICSCNDSPQPCPPVACTQSCPNGYRKDYSGCATCDCECPPLLCPSVMKNCTSGLKKDEYGCPTCMCNDADPQSQGGDQCLIVADCDLTCKHGFQRDERGCQMCSCNRCPLRMCRMFCMYGFRRNDDGCEVCECDWTPVAEKIQCTERTPCEGNRVCNLNLRLCEMVDPDRINWFVFEFGIESELFNDPKFVQTFKNGFINNVAAKYGLEPTQIRVPSVEQNALTSFQILPFSTENMAEFERKMDQIDIDLNSYEFRSVLPAVARAIEQGQLNYQPPRSTLNRFTDRLKQFARQSTRLTISLLFFLVALTAILIVLTYTQICRRRRMNHRSDSKLPIYDTAYQPAPMDDDPQHHVYGPEGTTYVIVESDDPHLSNDKRALV